MKRKAVSLFFIFIFCGVFIFAQETILGKVDGENLTLKIAVVGPGDEVYFWFGHIAIVIEDSDDDSSYFYDYGLFSFDNENFYYNFVFGRLLYSTGASSTERNIALAKRRNRSIVFYTLDLPPETRVKVRDFLKNNILPENRDYYYQHFKDNCSTRIRDVINFATDGQLKDEYGKIPGQFTYREHVRRHTWFSPAVDWILNFWLGQVIDIPIYVWDNMFLPSEVEKTIQDFMYTDVNGVRRKLVIDSSKDIIFTPEGRPAVLDVPRKQWPYELALSLVLSAIFGFFFFLYSKKIRVGKILAGFSMSLCGLVFGLAALLLYFLNIFTNHDYTYENYNMLFATPLLLAAVPLGISYALTKKPEKQFKYDLILRIIWLLTVIGIIISMIIKLLPVFYQDNLTDQMLLLPIALVFTFQPIGLRPVIEKFFPRLLQRSLPHKKDS